MTIPHTMILCQDILVDEMSIFHNQLEEYACLNNDIYHTSFRFKIDEEILDILSIKFLKLCYILPELHSQRTR